jgi:hypothetical protein
MSFTTAFEKFIAALRAATMMGRRIGPSVWYGAVSKPTNASALLPTAPSGLLQCNMSRCRNGILAGNRPRAIYSIGCPSVVGKRQADDNAERDEFWR